MIYVNWKNILSGIVILLVLFYLSPFSSVKPSSFCYSLDESGSTGTCDLFIGGSDLIIISPFKLAIDQRMNSCLDGAAQIESLCHLHADKILFKDYGDFYNCNYLKMDSSRASIDSIISIGINASGEIKADLFWWRSKTSNFSLSEGCVSTALNSNG
jgi:hypothetical protein